MNWPNALKRLRTCTCGRRHSPNIWVGEPSIGYARPGTMYNYGMCPPNYPVPAIWYTHHINVQHPEPDFHFVELRNSLGWADYLQWGDGLIQQGAKPAYVCGVCGSDTHNEDCCPILQ